MCPEQTELVTAIDRVLDWCREAQIETPDNAIEREIELIRTVRKVVVQHWPLPKAMIHSFVIGGYAAKNLADWNGPLADALMHLDAAVNGNAQALTRLNGLLLPL